jgi:hypothetical protein
MAVGVGGVGRKFSPRQAVMPPVNSARARVGVGLVVADSANCAWVSAS